MVEFLIAIVGFILVVGVLTAVHEFGHFIAARKCGVKILRFSIGFGKPLVSWHDKLGTEYVLAAVPLGGYVRMLGETPEEVPKTDQHMAFSRKSIAARIAIICAGPFANIAFAVFIYWVLFMVGISTIAPVLGDVAKGTIANLASLKKGYEILEINNYPTNSWEDVATILTSYLGEDNFIKIKIYDKASNSHATHVMDLTTWNIDNVHGNILKSLGLQPLSLGPPIISKLKSGYPAMEAGLLPGDKVISVDGVTINSYKQLQQYLEVQPDQSLLVEIERTGERLKFKINPIVKVVKNGKTEGLLGIHYKEAKFWSEELIRIQRFGPIKAFGKALGKTIEQIMLMGKILKKTVIGKVSLQHVAGPISIAKYAGRTVSTSLEYFLKFLALVSISLGVFNILLPIPILDGGGLLYCVIELVNGAPISDNVFEIWRKLGFIFLASLMLLALYNDFARF